MIPIVRTTNDYEKVGRQVCRSLDRFTMDELLELSKVLNDWSDKREGLEGGLVDGFVCDIDNVIADILNTRSQMEVEKMAYYGHSEN